MPITPTYPGVYSEVVPSQTHSVVAASTSNAAVIDWFSQGLVGQAVPVTSLNQFNSTFGGVAEGSEGSYAVQQFFLNGGSFIWVVRVIPQGLLEPESKATPGTPAQPAFAELAVTVNGQSQTYYVMAANPGSWGNYLNVELILQTNTSPLGNPLYTLLVGQSTVPGVLNQPPSVTPTTVETYYGVSLNTADTSFITNLVNSVSQYITIQPSLTNLPNDQYIGTPPQASSVSVPASGSSPWASLINAADGTWASDGSDFSDALVAQLGGEQKTYTNPIPVPALNLIAPQVFNILLVPAAAILPVPTPPSPIFTAAFNYCAANLAFFIFDPPPPSQIQSYLTQIQMYQSWIGSVPFVSSVSDLTGTFAPSYTGENSYFAATYYPWLTIPDAANSSQPRLVGPSGTLAGIYARNDLNQGVWTAPAGVNATLQGANIFSVLTNTDSGTMNPLGLDALRTFPIYGNVVWGARTLAGADLLQSQFKYINVLRLTYFIQESLTQSLQWAVFEPNASPLWSSITLEVTAFMAGLFGQGAFQGTTASQAYFVQCDSTTTTPQDMLNGIVNVIVGFAPVFPAEFVIVQIELQLAQSSSSS